VYAGVSATEVDVGTSSQDVTPEGVHDLVGNAREWTDGFFRDPNRESNDRRASAEQTLRAVRGLPVASPLPQTLPEVSTAFREPVCGVATCAPSAASVLAHVGFRCVRPVAAPPGAAVTPDAGAPAAAP
jgi:formylglycine-generating enzyme required for sulfatase activity